MKGNSDIYPVIVIESASKTQVRYNILEAVRDDIDGKLHPSFDFDYIEVEGELTKAKIIDSIISEVYSKSAELALINDELVNSGTEEFRLYQAIRAKAKSVADSVII